MVNRFGTGCASRLVGDLGGIAARHVRTPSVAEILWSVEGLLSVMYLLAGAGAVVFALRKGRPLILVLIGGLAMSLPNTDIVVLNIFEDARWIPFTTTLRPSPYMPQYWAIPVSRPLPLTWPPAALRSYSAVSGVVSGR